MYRLTAVCVVVVALLTASSGGSTSTARRANPYLAISPAQALRTCIDRWNQDNMLGWGPSLASIAVRRLNASEQAHVGVYDRLRRCTVSLAVGWRRDARTGCSGDKVMPGYSKRCVSTENTSVCVINTAGGYQCSRYTDGAPPLRNKNATTDGRGVLKLDVLLAGTHATPPLAWQRLYPHIDSFIHPWTSRGRLRPGLTFDQAGGSQHYHGACLRGSEYTVDASALKCVSDVQLDPCYPPTADWNRRGVVVACAAEGWTRFGRFVITRR